MTLRDLSDCCCVFQKGEIIVAQGEAVQYVYYLEKGVCFRSLTTDKGDEVIYNLKESGQNIRSLIGALSLYSSRGYSNYSFIAKTPCQCLRIPADRFKKWAKDQPEVLMDLLLMSMDYYQELMADFQSRQEGRVANRLCQLLLQNSHLTDGQLIISKEYTHAELGAFLGIHKVTVSRIIRALREEGVLTKGKNGLIISDPLRLRLYAEGLQKVTYK